MTLSVSGRGYRHEAVLYEGPHDFVTRMSGFVRDGIAAEEPVFVVVAGRKLEMLREAIGDVSGVEFADMAEVGRNPNRIIPVWSEFVEAHGGGARPIRGIGEPIWAERTPDELVECQRHEALLNVALAPTAQMWLVCPYDTTVLKPAVIEEALASHPFVSDADGARVSDTYRDGSGAPAPFDQPLPDPVGPVDEMIFHAGRLDIIRRFVADRASARGLNEVRTGDLVFAVNELVTNSMRHAGGRGILRLWHDGGTVICEVRDHGYIAEPLAGRLRPSTENEHGFGLWLVNHLCDLVQVRTSPTGSVVRLHVSPRG